MKRLIFFVLLIVAMTGCGGSSSPPGNPTPTPAPSLNSNLTVLNQLAGYTLQDARWVDVYFGEILYGQSATKTVNPGSDHLFIKIIGYWFKTGATITINYGNNTSFTINGETLVTRVSSLNGMNINQKEVPLKIFLK